jgi:protocatechuate 3,4-dioxygenase beta subunit
MKNLGRFLLVVLVAATGFVAPVQADVTGATLNGTATAAKGNSLVGANVQLEKYDADSDTYTPVAVVTANPSPSPTSTNAPYHFDNVTDGTYRVSYPLTLASVPTSTFATSTSAQFVVASGVITVDGKTSPKIPSLALNAMGKFNVKAVDLVTNAVIPNAVFTLSGSFQGNDVTYRSLTDPNDSGTAQFAIPESGSYSLKVTDPTGFHQDLNADATTLRVGVTNPVAASQKLTPAGNLAVTVTKTSGRITVPVGNATVHLTSGDQDVATGTTDPTTGVATFTALPPGDLTMQVGGPQGDTLKDSDPVTVTIVAGQVTTPPAVVLVPGQTISGKVTAGSPASPVPGARIDVEQVNADGNETQMSPAYSDASGNYRTNGLDAGNYNLYFFDESSPNQDFRLSTSISVTVGTSSVTGKNATLPSASVVSGKVTNTDGAAVGSVLVELLGSFGDTVASANTDDNGNYKLAKLTPGRYTAKFSSDNYRVAYSDEFTVTGDQTKTANIVLNSGSGITGTVRSSVNGLVFQGVQVSVYSSTGSGLLPVSTTLTQSDGTYQFSGLRPGDYRIKYDGSTASPVTGVFWQNTAGADNNAASFGRAADVTTRPGLVTANINPVAATPWGNITGAINNGGTGIESATVLAVGTDGSAVYSDQSDSDGNFNIFAPDGAYVLKVAATGFSAGYVGAVANTPALVTKPSDAVILTIDAGKAAFAPNTLTEPFTLDLSGKGATVNVSVTDETKTAVTDGVLVAYDAAGNAVAFTDSCDDNGMFKLSGLSRNTTYYFSFELAGTYAKRFLGGTTRIADAGTTKVLFSTNDSATKSYNLSAVTLPTLAFNIVTTTGANAPNYSDDATVEVYTQSSGKWSLNQDLTTTTSDGTFSLGVANGAAYRIRVVPNNALYAAVWVGAAPFATDVNHASAIVIPTAGKAPAVDNVVLNVQAGIFQGTVSDDKNADLQNAQVNLLDSSGTVLQSTNTREDGMYHLYRVAPGAYTLQFIAEGFGIKYVNIAVAGGETKTKDLQLSKATGITGLLLATNGDAVVGATVSVFSASGSGATPIQTVTTDTDGSYNFIGLAAGSYKVKFDGTTANVPTSAFWYNESSNVASFNDATTLTTSLGEYLKNIDPTPTQPWALIRGTILNSSLAVSGASVSLVTVSLATVTGTVVTTDVTDEYGNWQLYAPDGQYQIRVAASGYAAGYVDSVQGKNSTVIPTATDATRVEVTDSVATLDGAANKTITVDLAGSGGAVTVTVKDDASKSVTDGQVTAYDSTGNVAGYDDAVQGGVFTISGLNGTYRLAYTQEGMFAKTFFGDTAEISDPKTGAVLVNSANQPSKTINVKTLPKLTVNVVNPGAPATAFKQPVTVEVYSQVDGSWTLNNSLTRETSVGSVSFGVTNGDQYRIRVVPNADLLTPIWVGAARLAKTVESAYTITIPATGAAPTLGNVVMDSTAGIVRGTVSDANSAALVSATVQLIDNTGSLVDSILSREDGSYSLRQIVPGTYTLKFVADGYGVKYEKKYVVAAGATTTLDEQLAAASGISGHVTLSDDAHSPVVGTTVSLYSATGAGLTAIATAQTDANGNYNFIGVMPGGYKLYFDNSTADMPSSSYWFGGDSNASTFKDADTVTATLGHYASGIDPQATAAWTLFTGNIHDGQWAVVGGSVSLVSVTLVSTSGNASLAGQTDSNGNFAIYAPDGMYRVKVAAPGYLAGYVDATELGTPVLTTSAVAAAVLTVGDGTVAFDSGIKSTTLSLDLGASGGTVTVTVKDELKQTVTDGVLTAYDKFGKAVAFDDHSVGGVFSIAGLRGYYRLSYQQDGVFAETFLGDTASLSAKGTQTLPITDGSKLTAAINVKTLPKLTVNIYSSGTTAYKAPVTVEVYSLSDSGWSLDAGLTQETSEGALTFGVVNLSQYRIRLVPADTALAPVWIGSAPSALTVDTAKSVIIPAAGAVPAVSAVLNVQAATVSGSVTDSFANLMPGVTVDLLTTTGLVVAETSTIEDGTFNFTQVVQGTYNLKFSAESFADRVYPVVVTVGQNVTKNGTLDSASGISGRVLGQGSAGAVLVVGPRKNFTGVAGDDNAPIVGATVGLYSATGTGLSPLRTEVTDQNGYYNFSGLVPGAYRIRFDGTGANTPAERVWYGGAQSNAATFDAATIVNAVQGDLATDIDPAPLNLWTLFDGILLAGNSGISDAAVSMIGTNGTTFAATTDADGFFSAYAPDGTYRVKISAAGFPAGYLSYDKSTGISLNSLVTNASLLTVAAGTATFADPIDLMSNPLDLAASGGTLQVNVTDGTNTLTDGLVKVYDRTGALVAFTDIATSGSFNIDGLLGDYRVSYENAGSYAVTFLGGTKSLNDPATVPVRVKTKTVTAVGISAVALPKLTVNLKTNSSANAPTYAQPASVNVYQQTGTKWILNNDLSGTTVTGTFVVGVSRGASYRVQVVPDDLNAASAWAGSANAFTLDKATTFTISATGNAPVVPNVVIGAAVQVSVPLKNSRPDALENVAARVEVKQGNNFVLFDNESLGTLDVNQTSSVTIAHVPTSLFPIRVVGSSSNAAEVSVVVNSPINGAVSIDPALEFADVVVPQNLQGRLTTIGGDPSPGQTVSLINDDGDEYANVQTDDNGNYVFTDLPVGVHFTVVSNVDTGFLVPSGSTDFTGQSGADPQVVNFVQHYSAAFGGITLGPDGQPIGNVLVNVYQVAGATLNPITDNVFQVYSDDSGNWSFDGSQVGAEVGKYAFQVDGLNADSTPAYLSSTDCIDGGTLPADISNCSVTKASSALVVTTNQATQSYTSITVVLGAKDLTAPTGVKIVSAPAATTTVNPVWKWSGSDLVDGAGLRSEIVTASAAYGQPMSAWSTPVDGTANTYTVAGLRGYTYCFSVRMIDKSGNASAFTAPSCTTIAMDDTAMKPAKAALWSQVAVKGAYLGKVTAAKKNAKAAVINVTKASAGTSLCIYYVTGVKFGSFTVTVNGKKIGKPVATAGKAGQIKSICFTTKLKAKDKIAITVAKAGNGVQIDGYAITIAKPAPPVPPAPASNLK